MSQILRQSASGTSTPPGTRIPALEQNRSIGPTSFSVRSTSAAMSSSRPASTFIATPSVPSAVPRAPSWSMSAQTTLAAPSSRKRNAIARPIPLAAPVTTMVFPLSSMPPPQVHITDPPSTVSAWPVM